MDARGTARRLVWMPAVLAAGVAGSHCCVAEGELVLTPEGWRAIEGLRVGDPVFAYDVEEQRLVATAIVAIVSAQRECMRISAGAQGLTCTTDHPVYCPRDEVYADAGDWATGRRSGVLVVAEDGSRRVVDTTATAYVGVRRVFDISVADARHNFVAGGVLVHNKRHLPPGIAYRCDPAGRQPACPEGYLCCSDDPATLDGDLPDYGTGGTGLPLFSGANNDLSRTGMCVMKELLAPGTGLAEPEGCPIPCNPNWGPGEVGTVCGSNSICCHTVSLEPDDCVLDEGCWRPATGDDIFTDDIRGSWGEGPDPWDKAAHATAQDPGGKQCKALAAGDQDTYEACLGQLTVADQRGFCLSVSAAVTACPLDEPDYIDACEQLNLDEGRDCPLRP